MVVFKLNTSIFGPYSRSSREYESYGQGIRCDVVKNNIEPISAPQWYGEPSVWLWRIDERLVSTPSP
jgi:hypothetical protein